MAASSSDWFGRNSVQGVVHACHATASPADFRAYYSSGRESRCWELCLRTRWRCAGYRDGEVQCAARCMASSTHLLDPWQSLRCDCYLTTAASIAIAGGSLLPSLSRCPRGLCCQTGSAHRSTILSKSQPHLRHAQVLNQSNLVPAQVEFIQVDAAHVLSTPKNELRGEATRKSRTHPCRTRQLHAARCSPHTAGPTVPGSSGLQCAREATRSFGTTTVGVGRAVARLKVRMHARRADCRDTRLLVNKRGPMQGAHTCNATPSTPCHALDHVANASIAPLTHSLTSHIFTPHTSIFRCARSDPAGTA
eukprot:364924-Chlamydomonas_euryale.AAC.4